MEKRVILAIVLSAVVLLGYPRLMKMIYPETAVEEAPAEVSSTAPEVGPSDRAVEAGPELPAGAAAPATEAPEEKGAPAFSAPEILTTVETPLYRAVFSSYGAALKSFELKSYREDLAPDSEAVDLARGSGRYGTLRTEVRTGEGLERIAFRPSARSVVLPDAGTADLVFTGVTKSGIRVEKRYAFNASTYAMESELKVSNPTRSRFVGKAVLALSSSIGAGKSGRGYHKGPAVRTDEKVERQAGQERITGSGNLDWIGIEDKYFITALVPVDKTAVSWAADSPGETSSRAALVVSATLEPGASMKYRHNVYIGPKLYDRLLAQKAWLDEAIEFGFFSFMARPFLVTLNFFHRYVGNYAIAIIIITVLIKVLFYPLTKHSLTSMKHMQKVQPQLAALKKKYKDDKDKLNKEMMALYKRYKINPVGGCLPMVLQIPVFIALYEVLYVAIELRHAPFAFWIHDLSARDPLYITPIIMGASMFIQQKMTPTSVDPNQAKIMMIMPVVFTFMFLKFPSGLVLYWLVNNVLSIAQQYYIHKAPDKAPARS